MPCTKPACFGAISRGEIPEPKLWKLLANIATVVNKTAMVNDEVTPVREKYNV